MPKSAAQLDHVVLLLPYEDVINPPFWITDKFRVSAGGKHADGKTENRLIFFADGTYLELIAFVNDDPDKRSGHWWNKDFGIIDYALTMRNNFDHPALQERLKESGCGLSYAEPVEGGRITADKQEVKWKVTFPEGVERGAVPFWCHDVTPRERRVPAVDGNTHHPCGAIGVAGMVAEVAEDQVERIDIAMGAIINTSHSDGGKYSVSQPFEVGRADEPEIWVQRRPKDAEKELRLRLMVQCPGKGGQSNIEKTIGDGVVLIDFVNGGDS